jgi:hypothetical protein
VGERSPEKNRCNATPRIEAQVRTRQNNVQQKRIYIQLAIGRNSPRNQYGCAIAAALSCLEKTIAGRPDEIPFLFGNKGDIFGNCWKECYSVSYKFPFGTLLPLRIKPAPNNNPLISCTPLSLSGFVLAAESPLPVTCAVPRRWYFAAPVPVLNFDSKSGFG